MDGERLKRGIKRLAKRLQPDESTSADIEGVCPADVEEAATVVAKAFRPENFTTAAFGGTDDRAAAGFRALVGAQLRLAVEHTQPLFVARDGERGEIVGVAVLFRPGFEPSTSMVARTLVGRPRDALQFVRAVRLTGAKRVLAAHKAPSGVRETNYTLEYIAVRPDRQGERIGGQLLDAIHAFTDRDPGATGVYLVTAGEDTRDIYAAYGYETLECRTDTRLHPTLRAWHMRRPRARPVRAL